MAASKDLERKISTYVRPRYARLTIAYAYTNELSKSDVGEMALEKMFNEMGPDTQKKLLEVYNGLSEEERMKPRGKNKNFY